MIVHSNSLFATIHITNALPPWVYGQWHGRHVADLTKLGNGLLLTYPVWRKLSLRRTLLTFFLFLFLGGVKCTTNLRNCGRVLFGG